MKLHVVFENGSVADLENAYSVRLFTEGKPKIICEKIELDHLEYTITTVNKEVENG